MRKRDLRKEESSARRAWQSALARLDNVEKERLHPGNGRGDGGQGEIAWRENFTVAQAEEQRCWRNYEDARQQRIDAEVRMLKVLSAVFAIVVGLCTILQTLVAFW